MSAYFRMDARVKMKCIVFVSEAPIAGSGVHLPVGLSNIVKAWNRNKTADVTGFLCYRNGHYIEVTEGPAEKINQLAARVVTDPRHTNFQILIDKHITRRSFMDSQVNIIDFVAQNDLFKKLIRSYRFEIVNLTTAQKQRIQHFCDVDAILYSDNNGHSASHHYDGKNLRLLSWPDFNWISQSQINIDLCVKLTKKPYPFNQLMADNDTDTQEQIIATLNRFQQLDILTVTESSPLTGQPKSEPQTKKTSSFYHAIKRFLGVM